MMLSSNCNVAILSDVAIGTQQLRKAVGCFTMDNAYYEFYTSCEPCVLVGPSGMAYVSRLVCVAAKGDAIAIGFDEGPVFEAR
mmetsp:Transcript_17298/g.26971  ORF Transcript_17298/g.26971 Transcript_17298/m.26971 type:complete len:83 (+) Transcript_17298:2705-2953(+)